MFAYCDNNPSICADPKGCFLEWLPIVVIPFLLSGCGSQDKHERTAEERNKLRTAMNLDDLQNDSLSDLRYHCYGHAIGKVTDQNPTGYRQGDNAETVFSYVQEDLGKDNVIRLSGINDPIDSGWYRVALRCSTTDYHFIRQEGSTWYSKSEKLPVFSVTEAEVMGEKWYAILSNSQNSYERYHIDQSYSGPIIYFAIREGWSN